MIALVIVFIVLYILACRNQAVAGQMMRTATARKSTSGDSFLAGETIVPGCTEGGPVNVPTPFQIMHANPLTLRTPIDSPPAYSPGSGTITERKIGIFNYGPPIVTPMNTKPATNPNPPTPTVLPPVELGPPVINPIGVHFTGGPFSCGGLGYDAQPKGDLLV